jgi:type II secretory pathway pseudopilin PulG
MSTAGLGGGRPTPRHGGERGITILELAMVLGLMAVLATIASLNVATFTSRTRVQAAAANLRLLRDGMLRVAVDCGGLPVWSATGGDPGLITQPSTWGQQCWRGPYLNHWPSSPGVYEFEGPGGMAMAVVRVHSIPDDAFASVAAQIVDVFGPSATLRFTSSTGWAAEIPVSGEYQVATATPTTPTSPTTPVTPTPATPPSPTTTTLPTSAFHAVGGAWAETNGRLQGSGASSKAIADVTGANYTYSVDLQTLVKGKSAVDVGRLLFHYQDEKNYYAVVPRSDGSIGLDKMQNGKLTQNLVRATKTGIDPLQTHTYQVQVVGNRYTVSVDGKQVLQYTDAKPLAAGDVGIANNRSTSAFENAIVVTPGS